MTGPAENRGLDLVTLGEAMALFLAEPGVPLVAATSFRRSVAGAEANVAIAMTRLGHRAGWIGRVGDDALGVAVLRTLRAEGVDLAHAAVDSDAPTGVLVRDCHGERAIDVLYHRLGSAGSRLAPDQVLPAYVASARALHVTGITPLLSQSASDALHAAIAAAREAGVLVCLDPNLRFKLASPERLRDALQHLAPAADLVLAGEEEAEWLSGLPGESAAAPFLEAGARLVVIKRGSRGCWATDGGETWTQPAPSVRAIDPVGAGDAFDAGFLSGWLRGHPVADCLRQAVVVAALCVQSPTDIDGLPTAAERDRAVGATAAAVHR